MYAMIPSNTIRYARSVDPNHKSHNAPTTQEKWPEFLSRYPKGLTDRFESAMPLTAICHKG